MNEAHPVGNAADFASAMDKFKRYASVRDRRYEREPRLVTLTDDECLAILDTLIAVFDKLNEIGDNNANS